MKRISLFTAFTVIMAMSFGIYTSTKVGADAPVISITGPTGTQYVSFPWNGTITFNLSHAGVHGNKPGDLGHINNLEVKVNGTSIAYVENPFSTNNQTDVVSCSATLNAVGTCNMGGDNNNATVSVPWLVNDPGSYTITVSTKHQGAEGLDEEEVALSLVAVEYPAPPAVANAFMNTTYTKAQLSSKKRGCIVSAIAGNHAKEEKYGAKGGPYNDALIQADVLSYFSSCP